MKRRRFVTLALAAAAVVAPALPARAQDSYVPETLSLALSYCEVDVIRVTVDGAMPGSTITVTVDYPGTQYDLKVDVVADGVGNYTGTYPLPPGAGPIIRVIVEGLDYVDGNTPPVPFVKQFDVDRRDCPDLPNTGSEPLPIGRMALGLTLGGALLVVVAMRRRPRDEDHDDQDQTLTAAHH